MPLFSDATIVVVGHGSAKDPDAVLPTLRLAECLSHSLGDRPVIPAFMRGTRGLAPVLEGLKPGTRAILLPHFCADGVFTRSLIPEVVAHHGGHLRLSITPPLGMAPGVGEVIAQALGYMALGGWEPDLLLVSHGCVGPEPGIARMAAMADTFAARGLARSARALFLEHGPKLTDWPDLDLGPRVVVACLFAGRGAHVRIDIPSAFGLPLDSPLGDPDGLGPPLVLGDRHFRFLSPLSMPEAMATAAMGLLKADVDHVPVAHWENCSTTYPESRSDPVPIA